MALYILGPKGVVTLRHSGARWLVAQVAVAVLKSDSHPSDLHLSDHMPFVTSFDQSQDNTRLV